MPVPVPMPMPNSDEQPLNNPLYQIFLAKLGFKRAISLPPVTITTQPNSVIQQLQDLFSEASSEESSSEFTGRADYMSPVLTAAYSAYQEPSQESSSSEEMLDATSEKQATQPILGYK